MTLTDDIVTVSDALDACVHRLMAISARLHQDDVDEEEEADLADEVLVLIRRARQYHAQYLAFVAQLPGGDDDETGYANLLIDSATDTLSGIIARPRAGSYGEGEGEGESITEAAQDADHHHPTIRLEAEDRIASGAPEPPGDPGGSTTVYDEDDPAVPTIRVRRDDDDDDGDGGGGPDTGKGKERS